MPRKKNPIALVKGFVPVQVVNDQLVARVSNPSQKRQFRSLVTKIRKALSNPSKLMPTAWYKKGWASAGTGRYVSASSAYSDLRHKGGAKAKRDFSKGWRDYWKDK